MRSTASDIGQRNAAPAIQPHLSIVIPIYRERGFLDGALTRLVQGLDDY